MKRKKQRTKFVQAGNYVALVDVDLIEPDEGWSPYLSLEDAYKLDDVRDALGRGDVESATKLGRVFMLTPVTTSILKEHRPSQSNQGLSG